MFLKTLFIIKLLVQINIFLNMKKIGVVLSWGCCTSAVFTCEILLRIEIIEGFTFIISAKVVCCSTQVRI